MTNLQKLIALYAEWDENLTYTQFVEKVGNLQDTLVDKIYDAKENNWDAEQWLGAVLEELL